MRDSWMIECKDTDDLNVLIELRHWEKLVYDAGLEGKTPCLNLRTPMSRVYVCSQHTFADLIPVAMLKDVRLRKQSAKRRSHAIPVGYWRHFIYTARAEGKFPLYCWDSGAGVFMVCDETEFVQLMRAKYGS